MPSESKTAETKESKEGKEDEGGSLLAALTKYATTEDFSEACDAWYAKHSDGFEDADLAKEQRLEWTAVYEEYLEHLETELLAGFYEENETTAEKVFDELLERRGADPNWSFVPAFLQNMEYSTFIANMHHTSTEKRRVQFALDPRPSIANIDPTMRALVEVQGVYRCDVKGTDWAQYKKFYQACGVPKMFTGAFVWTGKKSKSLFAPFRDEETKDLGLSISIKFLFFGANEWKLVLGQEQEYKVPALGLMRTTVDVELDDGLPTLRQRSWRLGKEDKGYYELVMLFSRTEDGGMRLTSEQRLYLLGELKSSCTLVSNRTDE